MGRQSSVSRVTITALARREKCREPLNRAVSNWLLPGIGSRERRLGRSSSHPTFTAYFRQPRCSLRTADGSLVFAISTYTFAPPPTGAPLHSVLTAKVAARGTSKLHVWAWLPMVVS